MKIKGTGIKTTRDFIKTNFPDDYNQWLNSLSEASKQIYSSPVNVTEWYPMKEGYLFPVDKMIDLFYNKDVKTGAEALGRYSAEVALKGVYKVFLLVATPAFLMKRASKIMTTYYDPSHVEVTESSKKSVRIQIVLFPDINKAIEIRIAAWCQKALELTGCNEVTYLIKKSLVKKDDCTEISFSWI